MLLVVEGNFSVLLWSKLDYCRCTRNWTKLNKIAKGSENVKGKQVLGGKISITCFVAHFVENSIILSPALSVCLPLA